MFCLQATPYLLAAPAALRARGRIDAQQQRVARLRSSGSVLHAQTISGYCAEKRFEQIAESNAIEGSRLSVGETERVVLGGITLPGHDPAHIRDALALDRALTQIEELARDTHRPTDIWQLHSVHALLLGDRAGAGIFRRQRVAILGAQHVPPKTLEQILSGMEQWQSWSREHANLPAPLRSALLQAWLAHLHPYIDGNGRLSRASGNLELMRAGYPPIIIDRTERERYIAALAASDRGGDIWPFLELVFEHVDRALTGIEDWARRKPGLSGAPQQMRQASAQASQSHPK